MKAQFCDLVDQDKSTLMSEDMEYMATRELELEQKLSRGSSSGKGWSEYSGGHACQHWHEHTGKGKDKGKQKGDKGDKAWKGGKDGKGGDRRQ